MESPEIKRALISVSDKQGIVEFARGLADCEIQIVSTGGTRQHLEQAGIAVSDVTQCTGFPEMMDGRVKTLHPNIFAGILCRHDRPSDMQAISGHGILPFELVVVNLYPFASTIAKPGVLTSQAIEQIDIGGPSLIRAAAKNSDFVTVVCNPRQYEAVLDEIQTSRQTSPALRRQLMANAFQHTASYDSTIANYFSVQTEDEDFPAVTQLLLHRKASLRYGENSHQKAALYSLDGRANGNLVNARQLGGKQLSYNNLLDLDSALAIVRAFEEPACAVIKHNNPCGAGCAATLSEACARGFAGDPLSAFGSVVGLNRTVDVATARFLATGDFFIEAIVAPEFEPPATHILTSEPKWKKNVRLLEVGPLGTAEESCEYRYLLGGMLVQQVDNQPDRLSDWNVATDGPINDDLMRELVFGWKMVRFVKSNAITLSRAQSLVGVGAGQMSRVDAVEIAIRKAGERAAGSVLASDAFFPFADSINLAADAGIAAIIQPGGSVRDGEVIAACNQHDIPMVLTGTRHFRH